MGEMADMMTDGTLCAECGVYLEVGETVYAQGTDIKLIKEETGIGFPVVCEGCH